MTEELLADYLVQDGSARKHPFPIAAQLGSFNKKQTYMVFISFYHSLIFIRWKTMSVSVIFFFIKVTTKTFIYALSFI